MILGFVGMADVALFALGVSSPGVIPKQFNSFDFID